MREVKAEFMERKGDKACYKQSFKIVLEVSKVCTKARNRAYYACGRVGRGYEFVYTSSAYNNLKKDDL